MVRRLLLAALAALGGALALAGPAAACSCAHVSPESRLGSGEKALVGTVTQRRAVSGRRYVYVVRVERSFNHRLGKRVRLTSPRDSASCGVRLAVGKRVGAFYYGRPGAYRTISCGMVEPRRLMRAAAARFKSWPRSSSSRARPRAARSAGSCR
jgi:hypothetical protein